MTTKQSMAVRPVAMLAWAVLAWAAPGCGCGGAGAVRADEAPSAAATAAIHAVIGRQIEAFRHDDAAAAYALASPHIQALFGSPDGFMTMVRRAYPAVYRPLSVRFGTLQAAEGKLTQDVDLVGPDGRSAKAHYTMEREADGTWRIDACTLEVGAYVGT